MARVVPGRSSVEEIPEGTVVFLIGMRINRLWQVWRWLPVAVAMPRMLVELARDPQLGLLAAPRTFVSGRVVMTVQYWRSFELLDVYAKAAQHEHLPAWRAFNRRTRGNSSVGVFHETFVVGPGRAEAIYVNTPTFGLASALAALPTSQVGESAAERLGRRAG